MIRETKYDEVFEAQEHFRLIMDAMAKPGSIKTLDSEIIVYEGFSKASALIGFALLDSNTGFYQNYEENLDQYLILNTSSSPKSPENADFLFLKEPNIEFQAIEEAAIGEPEYPEKGAFLIIEVSKISDEAFSKSLELILKGPGVKGSKSIHVGGLSKKVLEAIQEKNMEYPLGVDTILTDPSGTLVCIPRSNQFTF